MLSACVNNCDAATNGEEWFYQTRKDELQVIFDVGSRSDSLFTSSGGEVHYFEPVRGFLDALRQQPTTNKRAYYNNFGLSDEDAVLSYYPAYQSFYDRTASCGKSDAHNKIDLEVRRADRYVEENEVGTIDLVKIDTEGCELRVLKGFGSVLRDKVRIVQFEYGGTFLDNGTTLQETVDYLKDHGFRGFSYLSPDGLVPMPDTNDHYQYCNIVCFHS